MNNLCLFIVNVAVGLWLLLVLSVQTVKADADFMGSEGSLSGTENALPEIVLNDTNKAPFSTRQMDGFVDIILTEAFRRIGYRLKTVHLPPERGLLAASEGLLDGDVNRIPGLEKNYPELIAVPEPVRDSEFCALSRDPDIKNTIDSLRSQVVGHIKGWKIYDNLMAGSQYVITADNPEQLFRLLDMNRIKVALYTCVEGLEMARRLKITGIHILKPAFTQKPMHVYLNRKHQRLIKPLAKALKVIKQEGLYDKVYQQKIAPYYQ